MGDSCVNREFHRHTCRYQHSVVLMASSLFFGRAELSEIGAFVLTENIAWLLGSSASAFISEGGGIFDGAGSV